MTESGSRREEEVVKVRGILNEVDLTEADRIFRLAFGTFLGLPDPMKVFGDRQILVNRWRANPSGVLGAYLDGNLVGSSVVSKWGSFGWFGPLTVRPDLWDRGIAKKLMGSTMDLFSRWGTTHEGLFTFPQSVKHVSLYQKFGFNARFLTAIMSKDIVAKASDLVPEYANYETFSSLQGSDRGSALLDECREVTNKVLEGLDLSDEIKAVAYTHLGDTVIIRDNSGVSGFAICHIGPNTEAGSDMCYVKFGAVTPGVDSERKFLRLLMACETFASKAGVSKLEAGINLGRAEAYHKMLSYGFRTEFQGVAMQKPNEPAFDRPLIFAIDDLR